MLEQFLNVGCILALTYVISVSLSYLIKGFNSRKWVKEHEGAKALFHVIAQPMQWFVWITGLLLSLEPLMVYYQIEWWPDRGTKLRGILWIVLSTWLLLKWKKELEQYWKLRSHLDEKSSIEKATVDAIGRFISFFILLLGILTSLQVLGMPIESFLAFGAVGAAGIAWASTDIVKNFFGGFMIHIMRPFAVGDWINSPEKEIEGTVEQIGWYQTQIRTFDKRPIYVPNGLFPAIVLRNPSRMSNRRIFANLGLRYEDAPVIGKIAEAIEEMLRSHPAIDTEKILMAHFDSFGAYSININVYCFTKATDWALWRKEQQGIFLKIIEIIDQFGAKLAFQTQAIQLEHSSILEPDLSSR